MSRGLTDSPEPEEPEQSGPSVQQLDEAMQEAYQNIYDLAVRIDTIERVLANFLKEPANEKDKKWNKGL